MFTHKIIDCLMEKISDFRHILFVLLITDITLDVNVSLRRFFYAHIHSNLLHVTLVAYSDSIIQEKKVPEHNW